MKVGFSQTPTRACSALVDVDGDIAAGQGVPARRRDGQVPQEPVRSDRPASFSATRSAEPARNPGGASNTLTLGVEGYIRGVAAQLDYVNTFTTTGPVLQRRQRRRHPGPRQRLQRPVRPDRRRAVAGLRHQRRHPGADPHRAGGHRRAVRRLQPGPRPADRLVPVAGQRPALGRALRRHGDHRRARSRCPPPPPRRAVEYGGRGAGGHPEGGHRALVDTIGPTDNGPRTRPGVYRGAIRHPGQPAVLPGAVRLRRHPGRGVLGPDHQLYRSPRRHRRQRSAAVPVPALPRLHPRRPVGHRQSTRSTAPCTCPAT